MNKNTKDTNPGGDFNFRQVIFAIMRTFIFLIIFGLAQVYAGSSYSQTKMDIDLEQVSLKTFFTNIQDKSEFIFFYKDDILDGKGTVSAKFSDATLETILETIFKGKNLSYKIEDRQVIIFESEGVKTNLRKASSMVQQFTIEGIVVDNRGMPLPGANVLEKGTSNGTVTDFDGNFSLLVNNEEAILVVSFLGFQSKELPLDGQDNINITLEEDAAALEEVVVIGYGTVKKSDLTGSVSSVKADEIAATPTGRIDDALRGKVPGLQITPTSSAPGAASTIRIRGSNSLSANNEPLYVIDGFIGGFNLNDINPRDIESIEVLKDASATAIYGSRGSNGVILITTKRGKDGKLMLSLDTYSAFQSPTRFIDVLNAEEFAEWVNEINSQEVYEDPESFGEGTNWQKEIFDNTALMTSHTLSLSGGNKVSNFFLSLNAFDQDGISINSNLKRRQFKLNSDHNLSDKFKMGNSLLISRNETTPGYHNTPILQIGGWLPTLPVRDENGDYTFQTVSSELTNDNPVARAEQIYDLTSQNRIIGNVYAEYEIFNGLIFKTSLGANILNELRQRYFPSSLYSERSSSGRAIVNNREKRDYLFENTLNYNRDFGEHSFNGLLGYTRQTITQFSNVGEVQNFVTDAFSFNNLGAASERINTNSNSVEEGMESYLFRANYGFKNKYLFTVSTRLDGSSVFAKNNKWGLFPSAAVAWKLDEESFMENLDYIHNLKLRASYGQLGNPGVAPGASLSQLSNAGNNYILGVDQTIATGIAPNTLGNDNLKWETTSQYDIGVEVGLFKGRIQFTADYYNKETSDLLVQVPLLYLTGFDSSLSNFGKVRNKGFELSLNTYNIQSDNFSWTTNFNISANRNEILELNAPNGFILINPIGNILFPSGILQEGIPLGSFYGLVTDGIWNDQAEIDAAGLTGTTVFPGSKRYRDLDEDGIIDITKDQQIIGDANPEFYGGLGNTIGYRNFELYVYWTFVYGNEILNVTDSNLGVAFDNNVPARYANRWTPTNTTSNIPSSDAVVRPLITSNSSIVEDGSFLRLRNINLAYNIPTEGFAGITSARVYLQGTNLLLFDKYSGYDPEISRDAGNLRRGYDNAQDPSVKSIAVGLTLDF